MEKVEVIAEAVQLLLKQKKDAAEKVISSGYPFVPFKKQGRNYTDKQKMTQFIKDGFIDRYSGQKLLNPGVLRLLSYYMPDSFPYHPNWKTTECHFAYWDYSPTVDHIVPIAAGGEDREENWATTSMVHNAIKSCWTLEQLQWKLLPPGDINLWDGLTADFISIVENDKILSDFTVHTEDKNVKYIRNWYKISKLLYHK